MFQYLICGLSVASEIAFPGSPEIDERFPAPDVAVRRGAVPFALDGASHVGPNWQIAGASFMFRVPGVARCLVVAGREVVVETETPATDADMLPFLLGTGFTALLHQRGQLVLHAAAVSVGGRAVALCGPTGVGKSTLAVALCRAGCGFISDDMSAIRFDSGGRPLVLSDGRQHRLWADTVERLSLADRVGQPVRDHVRKFHVDPFSADVSALQPLAAVVVLWDAPPPRRPDMEPLGMADAARLLRKNVHRLLLATRMGRDAALFGQIAAVLGHARVFRFGRMTDFSALDDAVRIVLEQMREVD